MFKKILLGLIILGLAGCATSTRYVSYTSQRFPAKESFDAINVYSESQALDAKNPYYVIGQISIEGFASSGVSPETLTSQAQVIARKRGADAIINAKTVAFHYYNGDSVLRFKGDLIVYAPAETKP
jgi:hypothetical protein